MSKVNMDGRHFIMLAVEDKMLSFLYCWKMVRMSMPKNGMEKRHFMRLAEKEGRIEEQARGMDIGEERITFFFAKTQ
jgi:hypothetical protein